MRIAGYAINFATLLLLTGLCGGCIFTASGGHTSGTHNIGPRELRYEVEGGAGTANAADVIILRFDGGTLEFEKSRALLDGQEIATYLDATKDLFVKYTSGKLSITADGAQVYPAVLAEEPEPAME